MSTDQPPAPDARQWLPPSEYLEWLEGRALPLYKALALDARRRPTPAAAPGTPPYVVDWAIAFLPPPSPAFHLLRVWEYEPRESRSGAGALEDHVWDAIVDAMTGTAVLEARGAPPLGVVMDGTIRTLEAWVRIPAEAGLSWHPPIYPWGREDQQRSEAPANAGLPAEVRAELDHQRSSHQEWSEFEIVLPQDEGGFEQEIDRTLEDRLLRDTARAISISPITDSGDPMLGLPLVRALKILRAYRQEPERWALREQRQAVERLGRDLLDRPMPATDRWQLENALTRQLDGLHHADEWRDELEETVASQGAKVRKDRKDITLSSEGSRGRSGDIFGVLASLIYEGVYEVRGDSPLKARRDLHVKTMEGTAQVLSLFYPPADLGLTSHDKLRRTLSEQFLGS